ncbi:hydrolase [Neiella marina]|uniref:Hydrolase n=1 Tax=Neiella marina TaxID=508461 RepID=A0A8J2U1R1_9GAMM|nr:beta-galactosidase [Neiella marina]GGA63065.1 hydrolase [Neiella marina]
MDLPQIGRLSNLYCRTAVSSSVIAALLLSGCAPEPKSFQPTNNADVEVSNLVVTVDDFNASDLSSNWQLNYADAELTTDQQQTNNRQLAITLQSAMHKEAGFSWLPKQPQDWSGEANRALYMHIANPQSRSVHIFGQVRDANGGVHTRSIAIPAQSDGRYYIELQGQDLATESGIRSNPPSWPSDDVAFIWRWGQKQLDLSQITEVRFWVQGIPGDRQLLIDDIEVLLTPQADPDYLVGIIDRYGQNAKREFDGKIHSDAQLVELAQAERAALRTTPLEGRSRFGGWAAGPKLKATGYFRTEKVGDKWALVDPDGHLFFSTGIANVRLANTSTITGYDFDRSSIEDAQGVTPEDSLGLNPVPPAIRHTRYESSAIRSQMFESLPSYDDPLGDHFGYRRSVHSGAVEKGETYSFYRANLERKYGETSPESFMDDWREVTVNRMLDWGFTSFGNWIDPSFYQLNKIPYFANGWIIGDFKTVSSGNDYWSPLPDPFDPLFAERAKATIEVVAAEVQNNPWCVGVFIDNEKSWGAMGSVDSQFGIVINTLSRAADESPTKAEFVKLMKNKYGAISQLNGSWQINLASWDDFANGVELTEFNAAQEQDFSLMLEHYASAYFAVVADTLADYMPNHMYMGVRFADWGMTPEIRRAAAKHVDVMSYNYYKEVLHPDHWTFLDELDMPSIIGEFHMGGMDAGVFNPGLVHAWSQHDRGQMFADYMNTVIDNPYFVGAHWFQYTDSPVSGRAYDGENYNVGFVSVTDTPYKPLVDAARAVNETLYQQRFGELK